MSLATSLLRALRAVLKRYLRRDHLQFRRDDLLVRAAGLRLRRHDVLFRYDNRLLQRRGQLLNHGGSAPGGRYVKL